MRAVFSAEQRMEDWAARRTFWGRLVIGLSVPMAYLLMRGVRAEGPQARLILALWTLAFACLVGCVVAGARAQKLFDTLIAAAGGRRARSDA